MTTTNLEANLANKLRQKLPEVKRCIDLQAHGRLTRVIGLTLEGEGIALPMGRRCLIKNPDGFSVDAEVIGFEGDKIYLMSAFDTTDLVQGAEIVPHEANSHIPVSQALLGRVFDGAGEPLDGGAPIREGEYYPLDSKAPNPLQRSPIKTPLDVGIRSINSLLTIGRGQRMGLFAGSGVGKSVLLGMMTRFTTADVVVVGLIGERGREVKEFIEHSLGEEGLAKAVVITAPSGSTPLMRIYGAKRASAIAEYYRDQGKHVLLIIDSLTRYAHAAREVGLARGELPATKGYPPSVFFQLSQMVERAGNADEGGGSITAFYTVLAEGDDQNDPIADALRSYLDGHIVLSRDLADSGHYPAIDIEASVSRVLQAVNTPEAIKYIQQFKHFYSHYQQHRDMIRVGAYQQGSDPELDYAVAHISAMNQFLQQGVEQSVPFAESAQALISLFQTSTVQTSQPVVAQQAPQQPMTVVKA